MSRSAYSLDPQTLRRQLASTSAVAVLLLDGAGVRATAGALSPAGFTQAAEALRRHWPNARPRELNRTVGLSLDQHYYLLFAKFLPEGEALLGLVFPLHTPLIRIRQDMTYFMRYVLEQSNLVPDADPGLEQSLQSINQIGPLPDPELYTLPGGWQMETPDSTNATEDQPVPEETHPERKDSQPFSGLSEGPSSRVELSDLDSPWRSLDALSDAPSGADWRPLEEVQHQEDDLVSILQAGLEGQAPEQSVSAWQAPSGKFSPSRNSGNDFSLEDTQPCQVKISLPAELPEVSDVTFYLVPAAERHFLIGELSGWLRRWLPPLCETYGWQLGYLSVRPDYLKWTLRDFPESLIREMLLIVRRKTSERIFRVFPNLKADNPTGAFWAPGYLVDTQNRDFSTQALIAHVASHRLAGPSPEKSPENW